MYRLTGIVLQDSYLRNKLVRFDAKSGGNGAGKTSILNLQPFFFGAEPPLLFYNTLRGRLFLWCI